VRANQVGPRKPIACSPACPAAFSFGNSNRSQIAYARFGFTGSAVSEFLSFSTVSEVSLRSVATGPQLAPPSVDRLTSIALLLSCATSIARLM